MTGNFDEALEKWLETTREFAREVGKVAEQQEDWQKKAVEACEELKDGIERLRK